MKLTAQIGFSRTGFGFHVRWNQNQLLNFLLRTYLNSTNFIGIYLKPTISSNSYQFQFYSVPWHTLCNGHAMLNKSRDVEREIHRHISTGSLITRPQPVCYGNGEKHRICSKKEEFTFLVSRKGGLVHRTSTPCTTSRIAPSTRSR